MAARTRIGAFLAFLAMSTPTVAQSGDVILATNRHKQPGPITLGSLGNAQAGSSVWYGHLTEQAALEAGKKTQILPDSDLSCSLVGEGAVVYVHGYNTSPADALHRAAILQKSSGRSVVAFVWPSTGWVFSYPAEEVRAEVSQKSLLAVLEKLALCAPESKIDIVAHSLGTRMVSHALSAKPPEGATFTGQIGQVVLAHADTDAGAFWDFYQSRLPAGVSLTVYASRNDNALQLSGGARGAPRLGDRDGFSFFFGGPAVPPDTTLIDTSWYTRRLRLNHSDFLSEPDYLADVIRALKGENVSSSLVHACPKSSGFHLAPSDVKADVRENIGCKCFTSDCTL